MNTTKTFRPSRIVRFSYGTCHEAALRVPVGSYSLFDIANLVQDSYLEYMFRPEASCLMSDECLLNCIGKSNFFAGALGGYETRLSRDDFLRVKDMVENDIMLAAKIVRFREPGLPEADVYRKASQNEGLSDESRAAFLKMAELS